MKRGLRPMAPGARLRRWSAVKTAQLIGLLTAEPHTVHALAAQLDVSKHAIYKHLEALRNHRPRVIRIAEWVEYPRPTGMLWIAAYQLGSAPDAKRPPKKSSAQRCREYRLRKRLRLLQAAIAEIRA